MKLLGGRHNAILREIRGLCKGMVKIYIGWVTVPVAVAERPRVLAEEVEAIDLKEEDREGTIPVQIGNMGLHRAMDRGCGKCGGDR